MVVARAVAKHQQPFHLGDDDPARWHFVTNYHLSKSWTPEAALVIINIGNI